MGIRSRLRKAKRQVNERWAVLRGRGVRSVLSLDDGKFLALIDPSAAGLSPEAAVGENVDRLLSHYERRTAGDWPGVPAKLTDLRIDLGLMADDEIVARAEGALTGDLHPSGVRPAMRGDRIDWAANPADSREWLLMLHRHAWWPLWGRAYELTGDEKYAEAFVAQAVDWIEQNPMPPFKAEHHAPWRLMECGLRLRLSWIPAFGCFYGSAAFTDEAKLLFLRSIYDHCNFLRHYCTNRNHLVRESNGLLAAASVFGEFREAPIWMTEAIARLDEEVRAQVNEDGSHIEMSVGYQWLAVDEFEVTRELLESADARLPNVDLPATLEKMYEFLAAVMRPDRNFPQLNDGFILWDADRLARAARRIGRPDLEFAATGGASGTPPGLTSQSFPNAGLHVMRSGWGPEDNYLVFDTGPYGGPHGHEDKLSFELSAGGVPFIVDPGSYTYQPDDPFRRYFVGSEGHNTVLVDGRSQVRRWAATHLDPAVDSSSHGEWRTDGATDRAAGTYDEGYAGFSLVKPESAGTIDGVTHSRTIVFVRPGYWVVADVLTSKGEHEYTTLFHLAPGIGVDEQHDAGAILRTEDGPMRLCLDGATTGDGMRSERIVGREEPPQGWYSPDHHRKMPAPTLAYTVRGNAVLSAWVAVPYQQERDERPTVEWRRAEAGGGIALDVTPAGDGSSDRVVVSLDGEKAEIAVTSSSRSAS